MSNLFKAILERVVLFLFFNSALIHLKIPDQYQTFHELF